MCVWVYVYIYMGPLQLAIYDSWWQAIELTKKKNNHQLGYHLVAPHCTMYIYIWLWVKTLAPSDPEDSWDLWMFIPRLAMLEKSRWAMFPGEPPPCFVLPPSVYSMEKPTSSWEKSLLVHKKSVMCCCCFIYLPFILVMSWFVMICCLFFEICSI